MTSVDLLKALVVFLQDKLKDYRYEDSSGRVKPIYVKDGFLKVRENAEEEFFPYVLVRLSKGTATLEESTVKVQFLIGVMEYDANDGYIGCLNIMEHVKQSLQEVVFIADRFAVEMPIEWDVPREQPYPEWYAVVEATFTVGNLQPLIDFE